MEDTTQKNTEESMGMESKTPTMHTKLIVAIVVIVVALLGYFLFFGNSASNLPPTTAETVGIIKASDKGPVARVNDSEISRELYNSLIINLTNIAESQGLDITDASIQSEIKNQAVISLVNNELLLQTAASEGIAVDDETVKTQYESILTQAGGEEALETQLENARISKKMLKQNIAEQLVVNQYLEGILGVNDFSVTDEEIGVFYNSLVSQVAEGTEVPALADVRVQLEQQLVLQKQQEVVGGLIEDLRANATVEVLI